VPILDLFSKRSQPPSNTDVYSYDDFPQTFRVQVSYIIKRALGEPSDWHNIERYTSVVEGMCEEHGLFALAPSQRHDGLRDHAAELYQFLIDEPDVGRILDAIELSLRTAAAPREPWSHPSTDKEDRLASDLNARFQEHGLGFRYVAGQITRIDSELLHAEVTKPALNLLRDPAFGGAQLEFLKAHEHYRNGRPEEALNECLKALESTMKIVCDQRSWPYAKGDTARKLLKRCFDNGLIPEFWQSHFAHLRETLECGVPTGRNKLSGHGRGNDDRAVPNHIVAYMLHMTASAIVFMVEANAKLA
jgi:hypothetical protein